MISATIQHCNYCNTDKPISEFYRDKNRQRGHMTLCKECRYRLHAERQRAYQRKYRLNNLEKDRARIRAYGKVNKVNSPQYQARAAVNAALRSGVLVRPVNCSKCGKPCKPEGHHADYAKQLEVVWLCIDCHGQEHLGERRGARVSSKSAAKR